MPLTAAAHQLHLTPVIYFMGFPFISVIRTVGLTLLLIILIEALVLCIREKISYFETFKLSILTNIISTIIGLLFVGFTYSSITSIFFGLIIFAYLFAYMFTGFCNNIGYFQNFINTKKRLFFLLAVLFFVTLGIIAPFLGVLTIPGHNYIPERIYFADKPEIFIALLGAGGLTLIGFFINFVIDGFFVSGYISEKRSSLSSSLLLMNVISYIAILITSSFYILETIIEKGWFFH